MTGVTKVTVAVGGPPTTVPICLLCPSPHPLLCTHRTTVVEGTAWEGGTLAIMASHLEQAGGTPLSRTGVPKEGVGGTAWEGEVVEEGTEKATGVEGEEGGTVGATEVRGEEQEGVVTMAAADTSMPSRIERKYFLL